MGLSFDIDGDKAEEAVKGFAALVPGKYIAKIVDVKEGKFGEKSKNPGKPKIAVRFKIIEGPEGLGRQFTDFNLPLSPVWWESGKTAGQFYKFYGALGVVFPKKGEQGSIELPDHEDLVGEEIGITLKNEPSFKNPDEVESKVDPFNYFPASDGLPDVETGADEFTL